MLADFSRWSPLLLHNAPARPASSSLLSSPLFSLCTYLPKHPRTSLPCPWEGGGRVYPYCCPKHQYTPLSGLRQKYHIKVSWEAQFKCYFTQLPSRLQRPFSTGTQPAPGTLLHFKHTLPLAARHSHTAPAPHIYVLSPHTSFLYKCFLLWGLH